MSHSEDLTPKQQKQKTENLDQEDSPLTPQKFISDKHYKEFCKVLVCNKILNIKVKELAAEREILLRKLERAERGEPEENHEENRKKRVRRVASDIKRHYECSFPGCNKSYGSEGSLNQHIKFKHPEYFTELFQEKIEEKEEEGQSEEKENSGGFEGEEMLFGGHQERKSSGMNN